MSRNFYTPMLSSGLSITPSPHPFNLDSSYAAFQLAFREVLSPDHTRIHADNPNFSVLRLLN